MNEKLIIVHPPRVLLENRANHFKNIYILLMVYSAVEYNVHYSESYTLHFSLLLSNDVTKKGVNKNMKPKTVKIKADE